MKRKMINCVGFYPLDGDSRNNVCDHLKKDDYCVFFNSSCDAEEIINTSPTKIEKD